MSELLFPKLDIRNFRGINSLESPELARVNLITGEPGAGKSTVLDALQVYAYCGDDEVLAEVLDRHHEPMLVDYYTHKESEYPDLVNLFHNRADGFNDTIFIGNGDTGRTLSIGAETLPFDDVQTLMYRSPHRVVGDMSADATVILSTVNNRSRSISRRPAILHKGHSYIPCEYVSPRNVDRDRMFRMWSRISLTSGEDHLLESVQMVMPHVKRVGYTVGEKPRPIVGMDGYDRNFPLYSFGSAIAQVYQTALAIVSTPGGIVLVDQPEYGLCQIHNYAYWSMVAKLARAYDVQVFGATSSFDSVLGFKELMAEDDCDIWNLTNDDGNAVMTSYARHDC